MRKKLLLPWLALLGILLACQANVQVPTAFPTSTPYHAPTFTPYVLRPAATRAPLTSATPTLSSEPGNASNQGSLPGATPGSSGELRPAATLPPQPTATVALVTPTSLSKTTQLAIFQELWEIVRDEYLYSDYNGLDWDAIHDEYKARIEAGLSNADFYLAMDEMIARLGDDHSRYIDPQQVLEEDAQYAGEYDYVGIGVLISAVPERQRAAVVVVFPGSPAEAAGLKPRDSIITVDGKSILDEDGFLTQRLRGPEGSQAIVVAQTPGEAPRELSILRQRITSALPVPYEVLSSPMGQRIGYIILPTFSDGMIGPGVRDALTIMSADGPLDGIILDNRPNEGGADTVVLEVLSYFTSGKLGYFVNRHDETPFEIRKARDIEGSQDLPMVVLVGPGTVSFGEISSGLLRDIGRAYIIGETTDGNVETLWGYDFKDGSRAWIAHDTFRPLNDPDANWEETGIVPDLTIPAAWDEFTSSTDPAIQAALKYLEGR